KDNFREIAGRMSNEDAEREAGRCLECGCRDYFECKLIKYSNHYQVEPQYLQGEKHQAMIVDDHPFIERDSAKCILCGLCVRICDELMGINALGLVHRGFDTVVKPEFGMALRDTACITCGQCVAVCPTGALLERYPQVKNVPVHVEENTTVCSFCGVGCGQIVNSCGDSVMRVLPQEDEILCSRGRFAFGTFGKDRLISPLIKKNGELVESSWEQAFMHIAKKTLALRSRFGNDVSAIFAAPSLTLEEAGRAASLGKNILGTSKLSSFTRNSGRGLLNVFGENLSTNTLDEVDATNTILMVGSFNENQVMAVRVRNAVKRGAKLVIISQEPSLVDDLATVRISPDNSTGILKEILAAVVKQGKIDRDYIDKRTVGYEVLQEALRNTVPSDQAFEIAALYTGAKKAMILVDGYNISAAGVELLADLAVITGRVGSPRNGIIVVSPGGNGTGVWHAGFTSDCNELISSIEMGETKLAFILGEDPLGGGAVNPEVLAELEFLVVLSPFMTATAAKADVVLPASTPLEVAGTYISSDGKMAVLQKVKSAPSGRDNMDVLGSLISAMNPMIRDIDNAVDRMKLDKLWRTAVKYETSFAFEEGRARFAIPDQRLLFEPAAITDPALLRFRENLLKNGLM
ncbi:MAG: molybdopterin-dependent oxidoreductase, partial [Bacteroidales bacterium]|nr:molybdopterin-dependent oxidoreductase [Bacteroidales bacterium]